MANRKKNGSRHEAKRAKQKNRRLIYLGVGAVAVILIAGAIAVFANQPPPAISAAANPNVQCSEIQLLPDEGNAHLQPGETVKYNSNPPTSGSHDPNPYDAGIYTDLIPATREVHSMEHGYVIIHYNGIAPSEIQQLTTFVQQNPWKMILSPLPTMPYRVSLTAWDHLQTCDGVNLQIIARFMNLLRDHGPERTPT